MEQRLPVNRQTQRRATLRRQLCVIIALAGLAAFLTSLVALRLGLSSMAIRYPLAVVSGYLAFLILIRGWVAWQQRSLEDAGHVAGDFLSSIDPPDVNLPARTGLDEPSLFSGGRSGGGGGGSTWAKAFSPGHSTGASRSGGLDVGLDLDELWPLFVAAVCALGGLIAIFYVIYAAPILLAEVALDAVIVSTLYRGLRTHDVSHWAVTVLRRTWIPALALVAFAAIGGYALERAAPGAPSIGGVIRAVGD